MLVNTACHFHGKSDGYRRKRLATRPRPVEHSGFECCSGCCVEFLPLLDLLDVLGVAAEDGPDAGLGRRHRERVPVSQLHPPLHDLQ